MADMLKSLGDAIGGFADFARGKIGDLIGNDNERYGQNYDRKASAPSAETSKKMADLAAESARRNGIRQKPMTPAAKRALSTK